MCSEGRFRCSLRICALALLVCLVFAPQPAYTQSKSVTVAGSRPAGSASGNHLEVIALNAALGAGTAAVVALITRKPVVKAAALGAAGGSVTYVGKTLATRDFSGAGFMGRQIGAVGASLTRDAVEGHEPFQRFILPLGIARLHVDAGAEQRVRVRADLAAIIASLSAIAGGGDLDFKRSLSKGTPVFHVTRSDPEWYGVQLAGVIWLRDDIPERPIERTLSHEMVHVLQHDASFISWAEPLERLMISRVPGLRGIHRWADLGLQVPVRALGNHMLDYSNRPWEWEASSLAGTTNGIFH